MNYNRKDYNVKFCVFLGRMNNMKILHSYINLALQYDVIDEYHMYDFSKKIEDYNYIITEYNRFNQLYNNRIFLWNHEEQFNKDKNSSKKMNWSPFYKNISWLSNDDIIIKCDDDILFIDINELQNAILDRINDNISFVIHSNCINNGVCAYFQKHLFPKLINELNIYPKGGILGILFEKPEIAYAIHDHFCLDLLKNINNINNYKINNEYITSRISINFILLRGNDLKYLKDIDYDDEYEISSFIREQLDRPNKIYGNLITSHLSYNFQEKILLTNGKLLTHYNNIKEKYIENFIYNPSTNYNNNNNIILPKPNFYLNENNEKIYKVYNFYKETNYYIKYDNKYLYIDYENDILTLSIDKKTIFDIIFLENNIIEIKLGIYNLTKYNSIGNFKNEIILMKYYKDNKEKKILLEKKDNKNNNEKQQTYKFKFIKYNSYLSIDNITEFELEKIKREEITEFKRFIQNKKIYYENMITKDIYTSFYKGWSIEKILCNI